MGSLLAVLKPCPFMCHLYCINGGGWSCRIRPCGQRRIWSDGSHAKTHLACPEASCPWCSPGLSRILLTSGSASCAAGGIPQAQTRYLLRSHGSAPFSQGRERGSKGGQQCHHVCCLEGGQGRFDSSAWTLKESVFMSLSLHAFCDGGGVGLGGV